MELKRVQILYLLWLAYIISPCTEFESWFFFGYHMGVLQLEKFLKLSRDLLMDEKEKICSTSIEVLFIQLCTTIAYRKWMLLKKTTMFL